MIGKPNRKLFPWCLSHPGGKDSSDQGARLAYSRHRSDSRFSLLIKVGRQTSFLVPFVGVLLRLFIVDFFLIPVSRYRPLCWLALIRHEEMEWIGSNLILRIWIVFHGSVAHDMAKTLIRKRPLSMDEMPGGSCIQKG